MAYIDDSLLSSDTYEECEINVQDTLALVDNLGLTTHPEKSVLIPSQCIEFVGVLINSADMTVRLCPRKALNIKKLVHSYIREEKYIDSGVCPVNWENGRGRTRYPICSFAL